MTSRVYAVDVEHVRFTPTRHEFQYRVPAFAFDIDELSKLDSLWPLFSSRRAAILRLRSEDYLHGRVGTLRERIESIVSENALPSPARVRLVTMPRYFGYVFNPVSFFCCISENDEVYAVVAEVNNTFGETCEYVLTERGKVGIVQRATKRFYVSPFFDVAGEYLFEVSEVGETLRIAITLSRDGMPQLWAGMKGDGRELSIRTLIWALYRMPFALLLTMVRIEWQALLLYYRKGVTVHRKPSPTIPPLTRVRPSGWDLLRGAIIGAWAGRRSHTRSAGSTHVE